MARSVKAAALDPWGPVGQLRGVGPRLTEALGEYGADRVLDLLLHLPIRYEDRTGRTLLDTSIEPGRSILVAGTVTITSARRARRRGLRIVTGVVTDGRGTLPVVWFNQPWIDRWLAQDRELSLFGTVRRGRRGGLELVNPEVNELDDGGGERIVPVYPKLGPLGGRRLRRLIEQALGALSCCPDPVPDGLRRELGLAGLETALRALHNPVPPSVDDDRLELVQELTQHRTPHHRRMAFDELLAFACGLAEHRRRRARLAAPRCPIERSVDDIAGELLPFQLTGAQRRVAEEIAADLGRSHPMARLVQGDVGCGKTALAALAIRQVLESGYQAALMAPTELLAEQHAATLEQLFANTGLEVRLLTSSLAAGDRRAVLEGLVCGRERLVVGTHALIQERVEFSKLGLVVVDEQHRFGVLQRQRLVDKGREPHLLVMTATPIPRSLALTLYGDLELSVVDELPPGRRPVTTAVRPAAARDKIFTFLRNELSDGGRAFIVYPVIDGGEDSQWPALQSRAAEVAVALPGFEIGVVHGRMARAEREAVIEAFRSGGIQVLLTTTVVEVGIDVPEASVVVVEGADRFGLSQLHQLRGRVGRGERRSWCILVTEGGESDAARRRLEVLCSSSNGFEIAEADLELRGPGELTGFRQWGPAGFRFADLVRDAPLVGLARETARRLAESGRLSDVREALSRYHRVDPDLPAG